MSADLDNQPYDNVEFPIRRPVAGSGGWSSPGAGPQRANLIIGGQSLAPVAEGGAFEEEEETFTVEDQRQKGTTTTTTSSTTTTTAAAANKTASNVILTPPRAPKMNHVAQPTKTGQSAQTGQTSNKSSTFPRIQTPNKTKPPPSPSRDSKTSFSIDQSKAEDFTWDAFGPSSQEVFETAFTRHKDFSRLSDKVLKQGTKMKTNVWDVTGKPGETMTYEQLLQGALVEGEKLLLGGGWLYFRDVAFYDPDCSKQIKPPLGEGRICLTNLRMLLLCAETASDAKLSEYGDPAEMGKGGYKLSVSKLNNIYFQNIPLDCFESVELSSTVGTSAESKLTQKKSSCCGLFCCVGASRCGDTWNATPPFAINISKRSVRLGVYMPPWRTPAIMVINLHPKMSLTSARDFVSQIQMHVPQMQYHAKHGATVL